MKKTAAPRTRSLQFEVLERREVMAAGITAALNAAGVLNVIGTDGDDQIAFHQAGGQISIAGVSGAWSDSKVKSIIVNLGGGDDFVSIDSLSNGGTQKLKEKVTVASGSGVDHVRLTSGQDVHFSGQGQQLFVAPGAAPKLNGSNLNLSSNVVASLSAGVLTVTGTNGDDNLLFKQSAGKITISGVSGSWSASKVKSIVVKSQDGTDYVSLDSLANGGAQLIKAAFTISSGNGDKTVHLVNGHDVAFSGAHTLTVAVDGTTKLDGQTLTWDDPPTPTPTPTGNWFDTTVQDAALRSLGSSLYVDGLIDRNDILALLQSAQEDAVVDAAEFSDLNAIASNSTLFGSLDYVRKLTSYVIVGNTANAKYQFQTLGNLTAGSSATQLANLVNKWFLGLDRPTASASYALASGTLFVNGASYTDIDQGGLANCGFMSSLAEAALRSAATVNNMFVVNGDGTYTVRFYHSGIAEYVTVDSYLPGGGGVYAGAPGGELWGALAEKAYAQFSEMLGKANAYTSIEYLWPNTPLGHITGMSTVIASTLGSTSLSSFASAYTADKLICLTSNTSGTGSGIVANHVYTVVGFDAATNTVTVFNPWGISYGLTTFTWTEVQANFTRFDRTA